MQYYTALLNSKELFYSDNSGTDTAQTETFNSTCEGQIIDTKSFQISHTTSHSPRRRLRYFSYVNLHYIKTNSFYKHNERNVRGLENFDFVFYIQMSVLLTWRRDDTDLGLYESRDDIPILVVE